ncbi:hypothetical protein [Herbiconiux flava]|uniref:Uncharacterized protein n=1 Tax=Herbiconiux flava TaxID=881268 RepID=A0A852SMZ2_9MICO|nr:hypothetical protein [Herbiconiux flava]NYD70170.1 hypothetical protein [Herbiconiux flava]
MLILRFAPPLRSRRHEVDAVRTAVWRWESMFRGFEVPSIVGFALDSNWIRLVVEPQCDFGQGAVDVAQVCDEIGRRLEMVLSVGEHGGLVHITFVDPERDSPLPSER